MSSPVFGRVHGSTIELEDQLPALEGKLVRVIVEVVHDPVAHAIATAPNDERPMTDEERAAIAEVDAGAAVFIEAAEVRARVAARARDDARPRRAP